MTNETDEQTQDQKIKRSNLGLSFDELVQLKAQRQAEPSVRRNVWIAQLEAMSPIERKQAEERFEQAFSEIASQFGRSQRFVPRQTPCSEEQE